VTVTSEEIHVKKWMKNITANEKMLIDSVHHPKNGRSNTHVAMSKKKPLHTTLGFGLCAKLHTLEVGKGLNFIPHL
jgi:hypothetical protein